MSSYFLSGESEELLKYDSFWLKQLVDIDKEIERLKKEEGRLQGEIKRCNGMLNNERFTSKAPQAKIDEEKAKLVKYTQMLEQVTERLATLSK